MYLMHANFCKSDFINSNRQKGKKCKRVWSGAVKGWGGRSLGTREYFLPSLCQLHLCPWNSVSATFLSNYRDFPHICYNIIVDTMHRISYNILCIVFLLLPSHYYSPAYYLKDWKVHSCALHSAQCTGHSAKWVHRAQCTVHSAQSTEWNSRQLAPDLKLG